MYSCCLRSTMAEDAVLYLGPAATAVERAETKCPGSEFAQRENTDSNGPGKPTRSFIAKEVARRRLKGSIGRGLSRLLGLSEPRKPLFKMPPYIGAIIHGRVL